MFKRITEPKLWRNYDETYCTVSLDIIWYTKILLVCYFARIVVLMITLLVMGKYQDLFTTKDFQACSLNENKWADHKSVYLNIPRTFCKVAIHLLQNIIVLLQI